MNKINKFFKKMWKSLNENRGVDLYHLGIMAKRRSKRLDRHRVQRRGRKPKSHGLFTFRQGERRERVAQAHLRKRGDALANIIIEPRASQLITREIERRRQSKLN